MPDDDTPRRLRWGWLLLAALVGVVAFLAVTVQAGRCIAAPDGGESLCTTGPALGTGGWMVGLAGACFVVYAVRRGTGRT